MDQYIGKMLDNRYEILECIGTGGMAVVYKARDHRLNRLVAVKILKPELASDADFRRRFHDESQAVAMLSHANIVSVYDVSHSDGLDYIVMELIDGLTLKQYMKKRGTPLNWREALHFITQIVRALDHAHGRGIIHRDIKPHNILVLRDGSVKVTDFGIAQMASAAQHTMTSETLGSVHYISPEQARGSHVDCRTDLYSAGVVLYEMLTGRLPFEGDTPVFVAIQHINSIPIQPRELNPDIPPALEVIIMKAMAPELSLRYASAEEMLSDLKEFRKNPNMTVVQPVQESAEDEPTVVVPVVPAARIQPPDESQERRVNREKQPVQQREKSRERRRQESLNEEDDYYDEPPRRNGWAGFLTALLATAVILVFVIGIGYFLYTFLIQGILSGDVEEYTVPRVLGYTVDELRNNPSLLDGFDLEVGSTVYSAEYKEGQICEQSPAFGSTVRQGNRTIKVTISGGEDNMYMQDVGGWDARMALRLLQDEMGLRVEQVPGYSDTITEGYIISYTPMDGTQVFPGDTVTIVISQGPEPKPVAVPTFINMDIELAKQKIEEIGLAVGKVDEYPNNEYPAGRVYWQNINATTEVESGTAIDLWVSLGPEETAPPVTEPPVTAPPETNPPVESNSPAPVASEAINNELSSQIISVDLSKYADEEMVMVRIVIGSSEVYNAGVNPSNGVLTRTFTASGLQPVYIYINGELVEQYSLQF